MSRLGTAAALLVVGPVLAVVELFERRHPEVPAVPVVPAEVAAGMRRCADAIDAGETDWVEEPPFTAQEWASFPQACA